MRRSPWTWVVALAVLTGLAWLPFAGRALSPDEGGLLILGSQWSAGSSLYGDYFVDRPPLLIALFTLADALGGGPWAVRALGILAAIATVLLAGTIGRLVSRAPLAPVLPAATAAILLSSPLFGSTLVNGEVLGLPFLLAGAVGVVAAARAPRPATAWLWAVAAGAAGAAGALVKQSLLDVFVLALVVLLAQRRARLLAGVGGSAIAVTALVVWVASLRGTGPLELWDAVIVFRQQAAAVIAQSATGSTGTRLGGLLLALLGTGAPLLGLALGRRLGRPVTTPVDLRWPAAAVLAWESVVVLLGGSYWLHYLVGLLPGLVLLTAAVVQRPLRFDRVLAAAYGAAAISTVIALVWFLVSPFARPEAPAIDWLEQHAESGDTAVVAFGGANILRSTGLRSPYPDLWSLPVRVHDPQLRDLGALLAGADRPTWLVVAGSSLGTWGVEATAADELMHEHYTLATTTGEWTIWESQP